ncbi:T9SS type A sorting domain-containing protein [uncultured Psychroserpens sp.]|uniref:T9SS type A sorting domain-containing protein n=1 Tax=uncultured Psychroserpens sp. TaxID=255436 RepID=UPI00260163B6|nr:T9SS type A sorting domain-containing protein [uncultured Psychroserpens sp.]
MKTLTYVCLTILFCIPGSFAFASEIEDVPFAFSDIQRVRIDITTPLGYTRHLLLGFTTDDSATDGFDYGYDAQNIDNYANDCNWMIDDNRYVIQGVGSFHESKTYPLGVFLANGGDVEFSLLSLENFDQTISVYIYDALNNSVAPISDSSVVKTISEGNHINRFYITFTSDVNQMNFANNQLSVTQVHEQINNINYLSSTKELMIKTDQALEVKAITLYSILGRKVKHWSNLKSNSNGELKIPLSNISNGTYLVRVKTNTGITNKRLIISK